MLSACSAVNYGVYAEQQLSSESDIVLCEEVLEGRKVSFKEIAVLSLITSVDSRTSSVTLVPEPTSPMNITHFLRNVYKNSKLLAKYRYISPLKSLCKWRGPFYGIDMEILRAPHTSDQGITVKM